MDRQENVWGYAKRLMFVRESIAECFPGRSFSGLPVLDVGCGNGSQLALPLAHCGFEVTGIDIHGPSIETAKRLARDCPNAHFVHSRVDQLNSGFFAVLILSEVLEHVTDPSALLRASLWHLRDDGIAIVTVPNGYGEFEIDSWIYRLFGGPLVEEWWRKLRQSKASEPVAASTDNEVSGHIQFFTLPRLYRMFSECSLTVVKDGAGSFLSGPIVAHTLGRSRRFVNWNVRAADRLPLKINSSWYFVLRRSLTT